ncbi:MAG: C40 family peptidase [Alphaproteobacteria bacterium]
MPVPIDDILHTARGYLGVRFRHQGRSRGGLDCAGLIVAVAHDLGLSDADYTAYGHEPDGRTLHTLLARHMDEVAPGDMALGDVVFMAFQAFPQHLGILADAGRPFSLIHAFAPARKVIEHRLDDEWAGRIRNCYRYRSP